MDSIEGTAEFTPESNSMDLDHGGGGDEAWKLACRSLSAETSDVDLDVFPRRCCVGAFTVASWVL